MSKTNKTTFIEYWFDPINMKIHGKKNNSIGYIHEEGHLKLHSNKIYNVFYIAYLQHFPIFAIFSFVFGNIILAKFLISTFIIFLVYDEFYAWIHVIKKKFDEL